MIIINKYVRSCPLSGLVHLLLEYIGYYQQFVNYTYGQISKKNFLEPSGYTSAAHVYVVLETAMCLHVLLAQIEVWVQD